MKPGGISLGWGGVPSLAGPFSVILWLVLAGPSMFGMHVEKGSVGLAWGGTGFRSSMRRPTFAVPWKGTAGTLYSGRVSRDRTMSFWYSLLDRTCVWVALQ